jgi:hypothetical protein
MQGGQEASMGRCGSSVEGILKHKGKHFILNVLDLGFNFHGSFP